MLISIDPGVKACGVAVFHVNLLSKAEMVPTVAVPACFSNWRFDRKFDSLAVERQYITPKHPRPQDILELAYAAGFVVGASDCLEFNVLQYKPVQWKGSVPKQIMCKRILKHLSQEELAVVSSLKNHNVIDAIGIGLFAIGRMKTGGT